MDQASPELVKVETILYAGLLFARVVIFDSMSLKLGKVLFAKSTFCLVITSSVLLHLTNFQQTHS